MHGESYLYECGSSSTHNAEVYGEFLVYLVIIDTLSQPKGETMENEFGTGVSSANMFEELVTDARSPNWSNIGADEPNLQTKRLYDMLEVA